ncbi:MAG: hypothetical protein ACE5H2_02415 [Terriglobia bacterium]
MKRLKRNLSVGPLALVGVLVCVLAVAAEEPAEAPLTEKQVKTILRENDKHLKQARKAHKRGKTTEFKWQLQKYIKSTNRLRAAVEADDLAGDDPEDLLWKVDETFLKQRKLLERLREETAEPLRARVEEAIAAARRGNRAALDALMRVRAGEFRVGGKRRPGIHQERQEEILVPGPQGPQRRPRPRPEPPG